MTASREKLHLRLTIVALAAAVGLPLLLHRPAEPEPAVSAALARCIATVLATGDLGPNARIAVVTWLCPPPPHAERWIDALH